MVDETLTGRCPDGRAMMFKGALAKGMRSAVPEREK
jgi:hypothetical protein